jgi:hypothetical protein
MLQNVCEGIAADAMPTTRANCFGTVNDSAGAAGNSQSSVAAKARGFLVESAAAAKIKS